MEHTATDAWLLVLPVDFSTPSTVMVHVADVAPSTSWTPTCARPAEPATLSVTEKVLAASFSPSLPPVNL